MDNRIQQPDIRDLSTVAVNPARAQYGLADSLIRPRSKVKPIPKERSARRLLFFVGELVGLLFIAVSTVYIFVLPAALTRPGQVRGLMKRAAKRTLDIVGASLGLVLASPLMAFTALLVKLDSPGPVLYTQTRIGENRRRRSRRYNQWTDAPDRRARDRRRENLLGRPFKIIKFRTMVQDAEKASGPVWATQNDARVTRVGTFLRRSRFDEIPQFWSVLRGDMSLVGPRPERPIFVADLSRKIENYRHRLDVKPGLTGLAQVENGYDSSIASVAEKVKFDLQYIKRSSLLTDLQILLKTVVVVVTGRGAC